MTNKVMLSVRVEEENIKRIKACAKKNYRTISTFVESIIMKEVERLEREGQGMTKEELMTILCMTAELTCAAKKHQLATEFRGDNKQEFEEFLDKNMVADVPLKLDIDTFIRKTLKESAFKHIKLED